MIIGILEKESNLSTYSPEIFFSFDRFAKNPDFTGTGFQQPHNQMKKGRLSASVWTDEPDPFSAEKLEIYMIKEHALVRIGKTEIFQLENYVVFIHSKTPKPMIAAPMKADQIKSNLETEKS